MIYVLQAEAAEGWNELDRFSEKSEAIKAAAMFLNGCLSLGLSPAIRIKKI